VSLIKTKMLDMYETTIRDHQDLIYDGEIDKLNHHNALMKAGGKKHLHKLMGCNVGMLNCIIEGLNAVVIVFSIPINAETGSKHVADRVMEIIENIEDCFTTVDYLNSIENKDDKFVYVTAVKKYEC